MASKEEEKEIYPIWIDRESKVISFREEPGFEKLEYPTQEEKFSFLVKKVDAEFRIQ